MEATEKEKKFNSSEGKRYVRVQIAPFLVYIGAPFLHENYETIKVM